jgi:formylglycine-generating enzyme required for sulfatase activity
MPFVWIDAGRFTMGGPQPLPHEPSGPQIDVLLSKGFYLSQTEVTQQQWAAVMESRPWAGRPHVVDGPRHPAVFVSWNQLQVFVDRLTATSGRRVRLPTEAEWEHACRSGGDGGALDEVAWYHDNAYAEGRGYAQPVATRAPDRRGLYDMRGNVWEWVAGHYADDYGIGAGETAVDPQGPGRGSHRVKRGGSFHDFAVSVHCGARDGYSEGGRYVNIGARIAVDGP